MSLRSNLARNLRALCSGGSVNAACRAMQINRQQFEKYLAGKAIPSAGTLRKISGYFGVTEAELFADETGAPLRSQGKAKSSSFKASCIDVIRPLWSEQYCSLKPGIYFIWMTVPLEPEKIVCAPVVLARDGDALTFRRIVGAAEPRVKLWWHRVGDHKGLVVERLSWVMLVGVNQRGTFEPSLIRLKWVPLSQPVLGGHATITTHSGISFSAVCMRPAPASMTFRKAVRQSRSFCKDDPAIDDVTRMILDQQKQELLRAVTEQLAN